MWAQLALYQALRAVMVEAAESRPGTDPDRCGFTTAVQAARDLVVQAAGLTTAPASGIAQRVLASLLPARRPRVSTRKVRSAVSRYAERQNDGRPDASRAITRLDVTILEPANLQPTLPTASRDDRYLAPAQRRRHRILDLLHEDPNRPWRPRDIAARFGDITMETMYRQLNRWAANGLIHKIGPGLYTATKWAPTPLPPAETR